MYGCINLRAEVKSIQRTVLTSPRTYGYAMEYEGGVCSEVEVGSGKVRNKRGLVRFILSKK